MAAAVTVPSGTEHHEAYTRKHPAGNTTATSERCGCTQGASTSPLYRNTSLSFRLHNLTWHPPPAVPVTRTLNRQGHTVVPQMRGDALAAGVNRWENTVPSLTPAEADLPDLCKNLHFNSDNCKCIWASWRHLRHHQGPGSGKYMQKALSSLQSARAVTRRKAHEGTSSYFLLQKYSWQATQQNTYLTETGDGVWKQGAYTFKCNLLIKSCKMQNGCGSFSNQKN